MDPEADAVEGTEVNRPPTPPMEEIIVRADEVDEAGANILPLTSSDDNALSQQVEARRQADLENAGGRPKALANELPTLDTGVVGAGAAGAGPDATTNAATTTTLRSPTRPGLRRDISQAPPPPPRQPPPPAPPEQQEALQPTDSLSLGQLKNIVANFPRLEPTAYAYTYDDARSFPEEIEEWFQYTAEDRDMLTDAKEAYEARIVDRSAEWPELATSEGSLKRPRAWITGMPYRRKREFVEQLVEEVRRPVREFPLPLVLSSLVYVALGVWGETAGMMDKVPDGDEMDYEPPNVKYRRTVAQQKAIIQAAELLCETGGIQILFDLMRELLEHHEEPIEDEGEEGEIDEEHQKELRQQRIEREHRLNERDQHLNAVLTILYAVVESGRRQHSKKQDDRIKHEIASLEPDLLNYLSGAVARLRWDENATIPFTRVVLLLWKSTLLIFGGLKDLDSAKRALRSPDGIDKDKDESVLTASPLDYHVFRQEITSKYPAYNPPPPLFPFEIHNNSVLPPSSHQNNRDLQQDIPINGPNGSGRSIFNQPVHIATPVPSPPPSPAGPGKGIKKQNYQTNQNFPFLYPPLDHNSNDLGGKGRTLKQDNVGRKWDGSDIPASIVEAGQLFASRMRMSRSLRQLWEVREEFVRYERGWGDEDEAKKTMADLQKSMKEFGLEDSDAEGEDDDDESHEPESPREPFFKEEIFDNPEVKIRLDAVEEYFRDTFPQLQSLIIVMLKILLANITHLSAQYNPPEPAPTDIEDISPYDGDMPERNLNLLDQLNARRADDALPNLINPKEDLNAVRTREITSKAISAFLLIVLKWFKLSHVLKFEYMTQLLLDSNYLALSLKYFALQDVDRAVDLKNEQEESNFFRHCYLSAGNAPTPPSPSSASDSSSDDDAIPPPIARRRPTSPSLPQETGTNGEGPSGPVASGGPTAADVTAAEFPIPNSPPSAQMATSNRPEVDELGYPTTALPASPLTTFAPRFFHLHITTLRVLQKLTKKHPHRALLLVQYKSSTILRKSLKVPQPDVRLFTLKLFKTQVPFCGRKWRQQNMRVITAIYVLCKMGLRDEWMAGSGAGVGVPGPGGPSEDWFENALAVERAWRGLSGWWLARRYRDEIEREAAALAGDEEEEEEEGAAGGGGGSSYVIGKVTYGDDFFGRELEKMGLGPGGLGDSTASIVSSQGSVGVQRDLLEGEGWPAGPLQAEGW